MAVSGTINTAGTTTIVDATATKEIWRIVVSNNSTVNDVTIDILVGTAGNMVACPKAVKLYKAGSNTNNYEDVVVLPVGGMIQIVTTTTDVVTYRAGGGV